MSHFNFRRRQTASYWDQRGFLVEEAIGAVIDLPFMLLGLPVLVSLYRGAETLLCVRARLC